MPQNKYKILKQFFFLSNNEIKTDINKRASNCTVASTSTNIKPTTQRPVSFDKFDLHAIVNVHLFDIRVYAIH